MQARILMLSRQPHAIADEEAGPWLAPHQPVQSLEPQLCRSRHSSRRHFRPHLEALERTGFVTIDREPRMRLALPMGIHRRQRSLFPELARIYAWIRSPTPPIATYRLNLMLYAEITDLSAMRQWIDAECAACYLVFTVRCGIQCARYETLFRVHRSRALSSQGAWSATNLGTGERPHHMSSRCPVIWSAGNHYEFLDILIKGSGEPQCGSPSCFRTARRSWFAVDMISVLSIPFFRHLWSCAIAILRASPLCRVGRNMRTQSEQWAYRREVVFSCLIVRQSREHRSSIGFPILMNPHFGIKRSFPGGADRFLCIH